MYVQAENMTRNYFVISTNDVYQKRYKLNGNSIRKISLKLPETENNKIGVFKATEASSGAIFFHGFDAFDLITTNKNHV